MSSESESAEPSYAGLDRAAWLVGIAGPLARQGLSTEAVAAVLRFENSAKCRPPLPDEEVRRLACDAIEYTTFEEGHRAAAFKRFAQGPRLHILDDVELEALEPPGWQISDILPARSLGLLYSSPGVGKTFLALDMGFSVQTGHAWHGRPVCQGGVVYVVGEGVMGFSARVRAWKQVRGFTGRAGVQFHSGPLHLLEDNRIDEFVKHFAPQKPDLVIVDTLARCMAGGEEDSAKDMGLFIAGLERVRTELETTVLTLHHPTKDGRVERGSGALRGAVDTVIRLRPGSGAIALKCEKQKDAEPFKDITVALTPVTLPDGSTSCVVMPSAPSAAGPQMLAAPARQILLVLAGTQDRRATLGELRLALQEVSQTTMFRCLRDLRAADLISQSGKGMYELTENGTATAR